MSDGTTLLFGLPGVRVERVERLADGTRVVQVATADETAAACPSCGVVSTSVKARVTTAPRDIPYGQDRIVVRWHKTRWRCREDYCDRGSFTEAITQIPARARTTRGCAPRSARRSATRPARWPRSPRPRGVVADRAPRLRRPRRDGAGRARPTPVLGIDETRRGKPRWERCAATGGGCGSTRGTPDSSTWPATRACSGSAKAAPRRGDRLAAERTPAFRAAITYVAIDPAAVYATAIRTPGLLPNATLVVDHFHLVKLANDALTKVRRRVTWDLRDRRGRRIDPEWANRRRLLRARERLSDKSFAKMWNAIVSEDDTGQILSAWIAKEELRTLLSTVRVGGDPHLTRHRLHRFLTWCVDSQIPELLTLAATVDTWWPEINAFIRHRHHQRPHRGLQPARQTGQTHRCGFRNRDNSARRIRFHCTRKQRAATTTSC